MAMEVSRRDFFPTAAGALAGLVAAFLARPRGVAPMVPGVVVLADVYAYTVKASDDVVLVDQQWPAPTTIRLPGGFAAGKTVLVKDRKGAAASSPVTIRADGPIDGLPQIVIRLAYGSYTLVWDGEHWGL
jgi:hypothetical protein